ncbi:MAG: hypothetical protein HY853_02355 [Burkholderiales bacterium]|nr:hypothetical protein [Burkholderiales bacterium]
MSSQTGSRAQWLPLGVTGRAMEAEAELFAAGPLSPLNTGVCLRIDGESVEKKTRIRHRTL